MGGGTGGGTWAKSPANSGTEPAALHPGMPADQTMVAAVSAPCRAY